MTRRGFLTIPLFAFMVCVSASTDAQVVEQAFLFGSRDLSEATGMAVPIEHPTGSPLVNYTMVHHNSGSIGGNTPDLRYDASRGWGFEVWEPGAAGHGGWDELTAPGTGGFDDSTNNRNEFDDIIPDQAYDSFIGVKDHVVAGDISIPEGVTFRIDIPNGFYRFVGAAGSADNDHNTRIFVEDGGTAFPGDEPNMGMEGTDWVKVIDQHNQIFYPTSYGETALARFGFDFGGQDYLPPMPVGSTLPEFIDYDASGQPLVDVNNVPLPGAFPDSPTLEVTEGYLRVHVLKGENPGGDPNGGDIIMFEAVRTDMAPPLPGDVNLDGAVTIEDFEPIRLNFGQQVTSREEGDLVSPRNFVDFADFNEFKVNFLAAGGSLAELQGVSGVPEPATALLSIALAVLCAIRRSNSLRP